MQILRIGVMSRIGILSLHVQEVCMAHIFFYKFTPKPAPVLGGRTLLLILLLLLPMRFLTYSTISVVFLEDFFRHFRSAIGEEHDDAVTVGSLTLCSILGGIGKLETQHTQRHIFFFFSVFL